MTHSMIRRFKIDGILAGDADLVKARTNHEKVLEDLMRDHGYVPLFDVRPSWSTEWGSKGTYAFWLTMHGVYVGKDRAWTIEGVSEGKELPKPTQQNKSLPSSKIAE